MTLALIAGQGGLPQHLVSFLRARGEVPLLCEDENLPSSVADMVPRIGFRLEKLGTLLKVLREAGVTHLCMAGAVRRPRVDPALMDSETMPLVPRFMQAMAKGDDAILRAFVGLFEEAGMTVIGAADIDPDLLPETGAFGDVAVPEGLAPDLVAAEAALQEMGAADLGQAVVVRDGAVIAREEDAGTDAMLDALAPGDKPLSADPLDAMGEMLDSVADWLSGPEAETARRQAPAQGGILYKAPKPGQELRVDMPVIGPDTVLRSAHAGLRGIVIEEGGVMIIDQNGVIEQLKARGLFLWVRPGTLA
ncbi:MAG: UDP-2,3-diacylglucosamine diphosphatase LpxI [Pseudomonadota bacterium]